MVRPSYTVLQLFSDIKTQLDVDDFEIVMQTSKDGEEVFVQPKPEKTHKNNAWISLFEWQTVITEQDAKTLSEVGIDFTSSKRTTLKLVQPSSTDLTQRRSGIVSTSEADWTGKSALDDDELALGASASPVEATSSPIPLPLFSEEPTSTSHHTETISLYPCKWTPECLSAFRSNVVRSFPFSHIVAIIMRLCRFGQSGDDLLFE